MKTHNRGYFYGVIQNWVEGILVNVKKVDKNRSNFLGIADVKCPKTSPKPALLASFKTNRGGKR